MYPVHNLFINLAEDLFFRIPPAKYDGMTASIQKDRRQSSQGAGRIRLML